MDSTSVEKASISLAFRSKLRMDELPFEPKIEHTLLRLVSTVNVHFNSSPSRLLVMIVFGSEFLYFSSVIGASCAAISCRSLEVSRRSMIRRMPWSLPQATM